MLRSLVGSEMCIRDRSYADPLVDRLEGSHPLSNNGGGGRPSVAIFRKRLYREHCTRCTVSGGGTPTSSFASLPTNNNGGVPVPPVLGCEPPPAIKAKKAYVKDLTTVSYTHLTLPTKRIV
eukprot:TRINITY_DN58990_c0_g1_i1.p1 TRINITY_DN58990_c0_g1~~TRINITY_DN58990_c0_g1_i1.p1  ORF type:complete len:121 (+),score=20.55 TRINITY_DN58990_c0_g1_i1:107-469(+)